MQNPTFIEAYDVFSEEWCKGVINAFNIAEKQGFTRNRQDTENVRPLTKKDDFVFYQDIDLYHTNHKLSDEFNDVFWNVVYPQYANKYDILNQASQHNIYSLKIQKTEPSGGYHVWHFESDAREVSNRMAVWTVYLNDDFEGGETEFLYQNLRVEPKTGRCCIFPAGYTHAHRGNPPLTGTKYIVTGWIEF